MSNNIILYNLSNIEQFFSSELFDSSSIHDGSETLSYVDNITEDSRSFGPLLMFTSFLGNEKLFCSLQHEITKDKTLDEFKKFLNELEKEELLAISNEASKIKKENIQNLNEMTNKNSKIEIFTRDEKFQSKISSGANVEIIKNNNIPENISAIFILKHNSVYSSFFERFIEDKDFKVKIQSVFNLDLVKKYVYILEK